MRCHPKENVKMRITAISAGGTCPNKTQKAETACQSGLRGFKAAKMPHGIPTSAETNKEPNVRMELISSERNTSSRVICGPVPQCKVPMATRLVYTECQNGAGFADDSPGIAEDWLVAAGFKYPSALPKIIRMHSSI